MPDLKTVTFDASQWQLVPKKVTDEMAGAFMNGGEYPGRLKGKAWGNGSEEWHGDRERFDIDYSAMLAAAPTPAAQSAGQEAVSACSVCYGTGFDVNGKPCAFPHVPLRTAYTNAVPVNGGECRDEAGLTESDYATLEREHFGDPDKRTGIYAERAADAQQVGGRLLGWDDACVVLNSWLDKSGASFDDQCDLYCQLAALTSPAKVGGDRDAIAELIGRLEAKYGMEFTVTKRTGEKTHHVGFDRHPLIGRAVDYLRAAITSPAKVGGDEQPHVDRQTIIEWLDALDIEVTDKQLDGLFTAARAVPPPVKVDRDVRELLTDIVTHHDNIVAGFAAQRKEALDANDTASVAYWNHEINVVNRMEAQARATLSADGGEPHKEAQAGPLLCKAAATLPEGWEIVVEVENGYGGVNLIAPDGTETDFSGQDMLLSEQIGAAIDAAIAAKAKGEAQ
ncbi:hypothetical protein [Pandoraea apista]|uniref:hypothetical protein n=1 Tax=Pandoraea apista TaxID=93218 RepID=UPI000F680A22|nr:hypothetical protein [Pandoraea apista]RRW90627.1 hypothetical protein EGJ54_22000 [Pandoraea apista]RRX00419.1 hypothetical protein EGJ56_19245 [Pandoraea apista]